MHFKMPKQANEETAWMAGRECAINGATTENCHFSLFARPKLTQAWERGKKAGEWEKTQTPNKITPPK